VVLLIDCLIDWCKESLYNQIKSNQIKIYIAPYVHEDSEALGGWITCSRRVGIDKFLNVF